MSMIGKSLAHYEITAEIGKGGMGEVYKATDSKLGRAVAIKVLPQEFAKDADRVARFQREAKLLAYLNHPNIAAIHGLESVNGIHFLVMELIEGQTLADKINGGPVPVEESLKLALQIAEALEAAHEKGVIHRDLKPANIKVTPDGKVKVLDFGLAKAFAGEQSNLNLSNSPTLSAAATLQGVILGTAAYMSPEQAKGKSVDKQADIWAFGAVLFEMLTGKPAFPGEDISEILASVIKGDSNLSLLPKNIHARVRELLNRCLQKDMRKRYADIADARYEIDQVLADPNGVCFRQAAAAEPRPGSRAMLTWITAAVLLTAIVTGAAVWKLRAPEPREVMRFDYDLPEGRQFSSLSYLMLAVSSDGKQFAYSTPKGLFLRYAEEFSSKLIPGSEGSVENPFFSPDGRWIGYFSSDDGQLKKISTNGGVPVALCTVTRLFGAYWRADNTIVYGQVNGDIMRVSANGGTPESLVEAKGETLLNPQILPDETSVLYRRGADYTQSKIMVQSMKSGEAKELFPAGWARYLPTGHIVYWLRNNLYAVPFDLGRLEVTGGHVPVIQGGGYFDISDSGTLVYLPRPTAASSEGAAGPGWTLVWVDRKGKEELLEAQPDAYSSPKLSPDGTQLALTVGSGENADIWIWDLVRKTPSRLTFEKGEDSRPAWSPDGKRIAFFSNRGNEPGVYWKAADGTGPVEKLVTASGLNISDLCWSSDGKALVLEEGANTGGDITMVSAEGNHERKPLLREEYTEANPQVSPDGRWLAYLSTESNASQGEIYVRPFPDVDSGKWQVSTGGGQEPRWSRDSRELFYRSGDDGAVMAVAVETEPAFRRGIPKELFRGDYYRQRGHNWDISHDGKRFLMIKPPQAATSEASPDAQPQKFNIVLNWFEELKRLAPVK